MLLSLLDISRSLWNRTNPHSCRVCRHCKRRGPSRQHTGLQDRLRMMSSQAHAAPCRDRMDCRMTGPSDLRSDRDHRKDRYCKGTERSPWFYCSGLRLLHTHPADKAHIFHGYNQVCRVQHQNQVRKARKCHQRLNVSLHIRTRPR